MGGTRHLKIRFKQLAINGKGSSPIRVSPNERDGWVSRPKIYEEVVDEIGVLLSLLRPPLISFCLTGSSHNSIYDAYLTSIRYLADVTRSSRPADCKLSNSIF